MWLVEMNESINLIESKRELHNSDRGAMGKQSATHLKGRNIPHMPLHILCSLEVEYTNRTLVDSILLRRYLLVPRIRCKRFIQRHIPQLTNRVDIRRIYGFIKLCFLVLFIDRFLEYRLGHGFLCLTSKGGLQRRNRITECIK